MERRAPRRRSAREPSAHSAHFDRDFPTQHPPSRAVRNASQRDCRARVRRSVQRLLWFLTDEYPAFHCVSPRFAARRVRVSLAHALRDGASLPRASHVRDARNGQRTPRTPRPSRPSWSDGPAGRMPHDGRARPHERARTTWITGTSRPRRSRLPDDGATRRNAASRRTGRTGTSLPDDEPRPGPDDGTGAARTDGRGRSPSGTGLSPPLR